MRKIMHFSVATGIGKIKLQLALIAQVHESNPNARVKIVVPNNSVVEMYHNKMTKLQRSYISVNTVQNLIAFPGWEVHEVPHQPLIVVLDEIHTLMRLRFMAEYGTIDALLIDCDCPVAIAGEQMDNGLSLEE